MMDDYRNRQRSHQDVRHLFNNVHQEINPVVQSTVSKLVFYSDMGNPSTLTTQLALNNISQLILM